ncbi:MAG: SUMF1/EgtB/PvdO family nonheme iron enzyme [Treponema sp.]|nr:SUMF1/EgtB/PvdO family nonheme iron enzyme [Treponema sp.]
MFKNKGKTLVFGLIVLAALAFSACQNNWMASWWPEEKPIQQISGPFFQVTFDSDEGLPKPGDQLIAKDAKIAKLPHMTRGTDGFAGWWFIDNDGSEYEWDFATYTVQFDMTLHAKWATTSPPNIYTITFDENGGSPKLADIFIVDNQLIPTPTSLRKEENRDHYPDWDEDESNSGVWGSSGDWMGFGGWYTTSTFDPGSEWDFSTDKVTATNPKLSGVMLNNGAVITLYAEWETRYCTVTFNANGGNPAPRIQDLLEGSKIIEPLAMSRPGYGFGGWYRDAAFTREWNFAEDTISTGTRSLTLHAMWVGNLYNVTFVPDGGSPAPAAQSISYGERIPMPDIMVKDGFGLEGWYRDPGFSPPSEWNFLTDTVDSNTTLYAKWGVVHYNVIFDTSFLLPQSGQGIPVPNGQDIVYNGRIVEPSYPTRAGYTFVGWYSTPDQIVSTPWDEPWDFDTLLNTVTTGLTGTGTFNLYARWVPNIQGMVWVPGGSFIMGDDKTTGAKPARRVKVSGFYMSELEVTQQDYHVVMGVQPSNHYIGLDFLPVERVSWFDAVAFCNVLTQQGWHSSVSWGGAANQALPPTSYPENIWVGGLGPGYDDTLEPVYTFTSLTRPLLSGSGYHNAYPITSADVTADFSKNGYRLPTEAEWEYAARGGNGSPDGFLYSGSDDPLAVAWFNNNSSGTTNEVGQLAPNSLGIYDMSGNVSEWCWDWYAPYDPDDVDDPQGPITGTERVRRGGAWSNANTNLRNVVRNSFPPNNSTWVMGFRVVRGPTDAPRRY